MLNKKAFGTLMPTVVTTGLFNVILINTYCIALNQWTIMVALILAHLVSAPIEFSAQDE